MRKELAEQFNQEVDGYRKALLYYARACEWDAFKKKAGKLFDYVESIELSELERRFFTIFKIILFALILVVIAVFNIDFGVNPELYRLKNEIVLAAIAGSCFELYFYLNFRMYIENKMMYFKQRRENFIRNIERDFKNFSVQPSSA